jgi:hypothetical protein
MLTITVPATEKFDEIKGEFVYSEEETLHLEHSLVSISKWESRWNKPFLGKQEKTFEEVIDYIKCMTLDTDLSNDVYACLSQANITAINDYIGAPMTATTFSEDKSGKNNREIVTSELIYYWMIALQIPSEYQYWHLNRLLTLIRVCNIKNAPPKKTNKRDTAKRYAQMNAARKKQLNTNG